MGLPRWAKALLAMMNDDLLLPKEFEHGVDEEFVLFLGTDGHTEPAIGAVLLALAAQDDALGLSVCQYLLACLAGLAAIKEDVIGFGVHHIEAGDHFQ